MSELPASDDPLVQALQRLLKREGGHIKVGDETGINDQSLYQIANGIKLPSGKAKGVGPSIRARLSNRYPDWMLSAPDPLQTYLMRDRDADEPMTNDPVRALHGIPRPASVPLPPPPPTVEQALPVLLEALVALPPARWFSVRAQLDQVAKNPEMLDDVLAELQALFAAQPGKRHGSA